MEDNAINDRFQRIEQDIKDLFSRTNKSEVWQAKYGEKIDNIESKLSSLIDQIRDLSNKPQKRWDTIINSGISSFIGLLVGVFFSKFF